MDARDILNDLNELDSISEHSDLNSDPDPHQSPNGPHQHSTLLTNAAFLAHMQLIGGLIDSWSGCLGQRQQENSAQYIHRSNFYASEINRETSGLCKSIKKIYNQKLPELESVVNRDAEYCKALLQIESGENQQDSKFAYLTAHQKISLTILIAAPREPLPKEDAERMVAAAKTVVSLQAYHETLMIYLQTRMQTVAPNLCQLVGSVIASKLISSAGGINKLAAMPACNIQVLGGSRSAQFGFSQMDRNHTGIFGQMDVVKDAPKKFQMQLVRMLATNTTKCARADSLGTNASLGIRLRDQMYDRFQKVQEEGGLMAAEKPMEIPDLKPKKKRGGKRHRKTKELYEFSELRKQQNRVKFGEAEEEIEEGIGLGSIHKSGLGKIKVGIKKRKLVASKKMQERANKKSGLESTLNLQSQQGIELINPALRSENGPVSGTETYFHRESGFRTVINNKLAK